MRDPYLFLIVSILCSPEKSLKYYLDVSGVSRGTFFKVKAHLEALGIISLNDNKKLVVDRERGLKFLADAYPGLPTALERLPYSSTERLTLSPTSNALTDPGQ